MIIPLRQVLPLASSDRTQRHRASNPSPLCPTLAQSRFASLFGLAPDGVYLAPDVTIGTGALLPHRFTLTRLLTLSGSPFPTRSWRFDFCGTFLRVSPTGRYPAPCSLEPGLSSLHLWDTSEARSSDLLCPVAHRHLWPTAASDLEHNGICSIRQAREGGTQCNSGRPK